MSDDRAASVAATRSFVTPASAETTTIGCRSRRSATMSMALATRSASPTEVPPNLMTITARLPPGSQLAVGSSQSICVDDCELRTANCELSQKSLRLKQFGVQNGRSGGAADGVVNKCDHAQVEQRAGTQPPDGDAHAAFPIAIESRLRSIVARDVVQRLPRCG